MSDLPRPETEPPWGVVLRVTANGRAAWYIDGPEISVDGEPGYSEQDARAITALHDWIKLADRQAAAIRQVQAYAKWVIEGNAPDGGNTRSARVIARGILMLLDQQGGVS